MLNFYGAHLYGSRTTDINTLMKPYPYDKYDWNTLLQIIWKNQNYHKDLQNFQKADIKKVELVCFENCECCKSIKNKNISINDIKELPIPECQFNCVGRYAAVVEFDLS